MNLSGTGTGTVQRSLVGVHFWQNLRPTYLACSCTINEKIWMVIYNILQPYIYIYICYPPLIPTLSGLHACRASIDMNMLKTFASRWWIRKDMRIRLLKQMIEANRREIYIGSPQICDGSKVKKVRTQQKVLAATRWFFWTLFNLWIFESLNFGGFDSKNFFSTFESLNLWIWGLEIAKIAIFLCVQFA